MPIDLVELNARIQAVEPTARIVSRWRIRRAIRRLHGLEPSTARTPHEDVYVVPSSDLRELDGVAELGLKEPLPDRVILLAAPREEELESEQDLLVEYWRKLFHASIDRLIDRRWAEGSLNPTILQEWWYRRGGTLRHEIEDVLEAEHRVHEKRDAFDLYREFAALVLELHYFRPELTAVYFPGLREPAALVQELIATLDAGAIQRGTKPAGVEAWIVRENLTPSPFPMKEGEPNENRTPSPAKEGEPNVNDVRAAIERMRQGDCAGAEDRLGNLAARLRAPLHLDDAEANQWFEALAVLLEPAARGLWPAEGRLLYELQKACIDVERKVIDINLVETIVSLGAHKLCRELTKPREINILKRIRKAVKLADKLTIPKDDREKLTHMLHLAQAAAEQRVRESLRPELADVLEKVGLTPRSQVEWIAENKVVEELLDVACERGFLNIGDVRDALARNRLKLPDLSSPYEWLAGDPLIRANRLLALRLDGVYHRGEIYMRWLQRLSSLAFGTRTGRFFSLWFALPFLGAFILLGGGAHLVEVVDSFVDRISGHNAQMNAFGGLAGGAAMTCADDPDLGESPLTAWPTVLAVGVWIAAMIHLPRFRRRVTILARTLFHDWPIEIAKSPFARAIVHNGLSRFFAAYLLTPALVGALSLVVARLFKFHWESSLFFAGGMAVLTGTIFRTSLGLGLEERFNDTLGRFWRVFSVNFLLGVFTLVFQFFKTILEWLIRGMYAVDEWLWFREGDSSSSFVFKLLFGVVWFFISYIIRIVWNLLAEPQFNPIKHFPVVTVSHKLLLPLIPSLAETYNTSKELMGLMVAGVPGIFGFLAWELKENWKLYRANQSATLDPSAIGSHGERIRGLLRPGFHSGVVPKTFAKLRRAENARREHRAAKLRHQLEHVAHAIHHFVERELIATLRESGRWYKLPVELAEVHLATNSIRIDLAAAGWEDKLSILLEERAGWVIGSLEDAGWRNRLSKWQQAALDDALAGFYKFAGVDLLRHETAAYWRVEPIALDCREEGPILGDPQGNRRYFRYMDDRRLLETTAAGRVLTDGEALPAGKLVFSDRPLFWEKWKERWHDDHKARQPIGELVG